MTSISSAETSGREEVDDLIVEPDKSTVDDWFGQDDRRDTADAEWLSREAGSDGVLAGEIREEHRRPYERDCCNVPKDGRPA